MEGFGKADSASHPFLVFNEFVAGQIASVVGVPVPPGAPAILDSGVEKIWISLSFSKPGAGPPPPTTGSAVVKASERMACKILAFDVLIGNGDRHEGNVSVSSNRIDLWDHDRAILSHGIPQLMSTPDAMAYLACYQNDFIVDGVTDRLSQAHLLLDAVSDEANFWRRPSKFNAAAQTRLLRKLSMMRAAYSCPALVLPLLNAWENS